VLILNRFYNVTSLVHFYIVIIVFLGLASGLLLVHLALVPLVLFHCLHICSVILSFNCGMESINWTETEQTIDSAPLPHPVCWRVGVRCMQDMFQNAVEFLKLEKVEYAGIKGRMLSSQTVAIYEEFNEMYKAFQEVTYDPLDPQDTVNAPSSSCCLTVIWDFGGFVLL